MNLSNSPCMVPLSIYLEELDLRPFIPKDFTNTTAGYVLNFCYERPPSKVRLMVAIQQGPQGLLDFLENYKQVRTRKRQEELERIVPDYIHYRTKVHPHSPDGSPYSEVDSLLEIYNNVQRDICYSLCIASADWQRWKRGERVNPSNDLKSVIRFLESHVPSKEPTEPTE